MAVIETARFMLAQGADEAEFLGENARAQSFVAEQPGYLGRHTGRNDEGEWLVVVFWRSAADAEASVGRFMAEPSLERFRSMLDGGTLRMDRYDVR